MASQLLGATGKPISLSQRAAGCVALLSVSQRTSRRRSSGVSASQSLIAAGLGASFVLGKHSGRHAVAKRAEALGHVLSGDHLNAAFSGFKTRADQIGEIDDRELLAIVEAARPAPRYEETAYAAAG